MHFHKIHLCNNTILYANLSFFNHQILQLRLFTNVVNEIFDFSNIPLITKKIDKKKSDITHLASNANDKFDPFTQWTNTTIIIASPLELSSQLIRVLLVSPIKILLSYY